MSELRRDETNTRPGAHEAGADGPPGPAPSLAGFLPRGIIGGVLMGLANLVPGISGGTMLLAAGIYPAFIESIAELTRLRFRAWPMIVLGTIGGSALLAILGLAGPTRTLVIEQRALMYSFFIGLTLGGVPLVWRLARPITPAAAASAAGAFALMAAMAVELDPGGQGAASAPLLLLSGLAGASAMILPGISGGYLLLLLGQYEPILGAIDDVKQGLLGEAGLDVGRILGASEIVAPVGLGVIVGVVGVSNGLRWLLERYAKPTLGALLGLLLGAVIGLYPFQESVDLENAGAHPVVSDNDHAARDEPRLRRYVPSIDEASRAGAALLTGLALTWVVARIGRGSED